MLDYEAHVRTVIASGSYVLSDLEDRIDALWVEGKIDAGQRSELKRLAAENARDAEQIDILEKLDSLDRRVYELEHPTDIYTVWVPGYVTHKGEIVRFDVTGDGEYDLCQYNGGRTETALSIGKINGWNMLDRELNVVADITRDADGGYIVTPIPEPEPESDSDGSEDEEGPADVDDGEDASDEPTIDYNAMTKAQLLELCAERGITGPTSSWTKAEIIAALTGE